MLCPAQILGKAGNVISGTLCTVTVWLIGNVPHELMSCSVTVYVPCELNVICGCQLLALVPLVKLNAPLAGTQGEPLNVTTQFQFTSQESEVSDKLVMLLIKGTHPEVGDKVKLGTGGASMQTVRVMVVVPQPLLVLNTTV